MADTVGYREQLVCRFQAFTNEFPLAVAAGARG